MTTDSARDGQQTGRVEGERGLMLTLLAIVVLGIAAIFVVSG